MPQLKNKRIAVVCNYQLKPDRIGGMDRFYKAFDIAVKNEGGTIDWFFSASQDFEFYKNMTIYSAKDNDVKKLFISHTKANSLEYDFVITHFIELCIDFYKQIKTFYKSYIIAVDHNPRPFEGYSLKKKVKNRLKGLLYSRYIDQFVGVSNYTKKHILKDYGNFLNKKTVVVYNGIYTSVFIKRTKENLNKFIVASHLRPSKGIQDLIQAVAIIDKSLLSKLHIDIFGEGPIEKELKSLVKEKGLSQSIFFKGSSSQLHLEFQNYRYLLQPTYMECFSLSILESLSANVPVITTEVGGNLEVINHNENGYIFPAGNIAKLASIITDVLTNKSSIDIDVSANIETNYYLDKMVNEHLNLITCI